MDKRLIKSIKSNIEKLDEKIKTNLSEAFDMKNRREKFQEMLALVEPKTELPPAADDTAAATSPEEVPQGKPPAFLANVKKASDKENAA